MKLHIYQVSYTNQVPFFLENKSSLANLTTLSVSHRRPVVVVYQVLLIGCIFMPLCVYQDSRCMCKGLRLKIDGNVQDRLLGVHNGLYIHTAVREEKRKNGKQIVSFLRVFVETSTADGRYNRTTTMPPTGACSLIPVLLSAWHTHRQIDGNNEQ